MKKYILLLFLGITFTLNAQDIKINILPATQEYDTWCGVAASQCVLRYFGPYVRQCTIMEYVRKETGSYGIYDCCDTAHVHQGCNAGGIDLYGGKGSVQAILSHFGTINSVAHPLFYPWTYEISVYLRNDRPLIISLRNKFNNAQHAVVVYGKDIGYGNDLIYYMDPDPDYGYQNETYFKLTTGFNIPFTWFNTLVIGDALYPAHCFNGECDEDEDDVDCGGLWCEPCKTTPPLPPTCSNCERDPGEVQVDCGGPDCPPCEDAPEERDIVNSSNLPSEVVAHKKITARQYVKVLSGQNVSFITSDTGSIVLLPGFSAQKGSDFSTQRKDLSGYSRICPEKLCTTAWLKYYHYRGTAIKLDIYDLLYAVKIIYYIFDEKGQFVYDDAIDIARNGTFRLWDCETGAIITQGKVAYDILYSVLYCNEEWRGYSHRFVVMDVPNMSKSLNKEFEETETPPQFSSPSFNNIIHQDENVTHTFSIIPNPNPGTFQIETNFPLTDIANLKITNMLGATVYETQNFISNTIQLQTAATGTFLVVIILKDGTMLTQKMVMQR
jgi:hypothetical protein